MFRFKHPTFDAKKRKTEPDYHAVLFPTGYLSYDPSLSLDMSREVPHLLCRVIVLIRQIYLQGCQFFGFDAERRDVVI